VTVTLSEKVARSLSHQAPRDVDQTTRIEALRGSCKVFAETLEALTEPSREQSLAITNLEQALMWAIKGIVLEPPKEPVK
jgi:hypothetical protein